MLDKSTLQELAREYGTPLFIVDHEEIKKNYAEFRECLPRVKPYYAVKCNPDPAIVRTLYEIGAGFDVASMPEFDIVYENIKDLPDEERQEFIWENIIYAHPIKDKRTLRELNRYKPLVTYDNAAEIDKVRDNAPEAGLCLRLKVPNTGAVVELSSKFGADPGEAVDLILEADEHGLEVEGLSFHVGSQTTNFENYVHALQICAGVFREARARGYHKMNLLDIGGGFPAPYAADDIEFRELAYILSTELDRLFPKDIEILAEPGRFLVATSGTLVASVIGKAVRNGKQAYYINDGVYHTYSGIIFDHCQYRVESFKDYTDTEICSVFGPTCDALDTISLAEELPPMEIDDLVFSRNIGAYSHASSTRFNGFPPAMVLHLNTGSDDEFRGKMVMPPVRNRSLATK